jgi:hypothetical protein
MRYTPNLHSELLIHFLNAEDTKPTDIHHYMICMDSNGLTAKDQEFVWVQKFR